MLNCLIETYPERVAALGDGVPKGRFAGVPTALKDLYKFEHIRPRPSTGDRSIHRAGPDNLMRTSYAMYRYGKTVSACQYLAALDEYNTVRRSTGAFFTTRLALPHGVHHQDQDYEAVAWSRHIFAPESFAPLFNVTGQPAISLPLHAAANGPPIGIHHSTSRCSRSAVWCARARRDVSEHTASLRSQ